MFSNHSSFLNRRHFLKAAAVGLAAAPAILNAADPIQRIGQPRLKLSLAAYSFRQLLPNRPEAPVEGKWTLLDFIDFCAEMDLEGTELTSYYFPKNLTEDYLRQIQERAFRNGLSISGTAIGNNFCVPEGPAREEQLALTREWIDHASIMGAPVIRIFAGNIPKGDTLENAMGRCVSAIDESVAYAATKGVVLGLENHGGITATSEQLLKIVKSVKPSPWFGINFDSGNFRTEDPYRDLEAIAPYAVNAQIKVQVHPKGKPDEDADYKRIAKILKDAGYRGFVALEYEGKDDAQTAVPPILDEIREAIA